MKFNKCLLNVVRGSSLWQQNYAKMIKCNLPSNTMLTDRFYHEFNHITIECTAYYN